jgi:hypothetical protein
MVVSVLALAAGLGGIGYAASGDGAAKQGTLKSGKTEKGVYFVGAFESGAGSGQFAEQEVSYPVPLKAAPERTFVGEGETPPGPCPGTFAKPKAKPGHLCVYEKDGGGRDSGDVTFGFDDARDKLGFGVTVGSAVAANQFYFSEGSWAVTAE